VQEEVRRARLQGQADTRAKAAARPELPAQQRVRVAPRRVRVAVRRVRVAVRRVRVAVRRVRVAVRRVRVAPRRAPEEQRPCRPTFRTS
jgi:hypothetical protein